MNSKVLKYGGSASVEINTKIADLAMKNFASPIIHGLSFCTTPIELLKNDGSGEIHATATGFFWRCKGKPYLVTNYHVISGRNPFTGKLLCDMSYIPEVIRFYGCSFAVSNGHVSFKRQAYTLNTVGDMDQILTTPPLINGIPVDVFAIPIPDNLIFGKDPARGGFSGAKTASCFINDSLGEPIRSMAGDDCIILGYPLANSEGLKVPIWKHGHIASEPLLGVDGKPIFLVDATVTPSMSGSPILRIAKTFTANNKDINAIQEFSTINLIGIYAGRLQSSTLEKTNLGYGWYKVLINKVIDNYPLGNWVSKP